MFRYLPLQFLSVIIVTVAKENCKGNLMSKCNRKRTQLLYLKHKGKCVYCKKRTFLSESGIDGQEHPLMATTEHKYPRNDLRRYTGRHGNSYTLLACSKCNGEKARESHAYIEEQNRLYKLFEESFSLVKFYQSRLKWEELRNNLKTN